MMQYSYTAKDSSGKVVKGLVEAQNVMDLYKQLESEELYCLGYTEKELREQAVRTIYKIKVKELVIFCRKMSTMMASGMSMTSALDTLISSTESPKLRQVYANVYEAVRGGQSFSEALRAQGNAFSALLINMVESGEESGNIDLMFTKLSIYFEKQAKLQAKIKTATTYPKLLAVLCVGVVIILFSFVLPQIFTAFSGMELPDLTKAMIAISDFLTNYWYFVVAGVVVVYFIARSMLKVPSVLYKRDRMLLRIPKIGKLLRQIYSSRFANTLSILYASGLSLINAIRLSVNVVGNSYIAHQLRSIIEEVSVGNSLSVSLEEADVFDSMLPSMVRIGEETGSLDSILNSTSEYYERETESAIEAILAILEPVMLIIMAIIIGTILISVLMPIFESYGQVAA